MGKQNSQYCCAGIGELLWDILPDGETLGGAPVNFAYHVNALGARGIPVSTVGSDNRGKAALSELERNGINTSAISHSESYPTGYVDASIDAQGIASYHFPDDVAWDHLHINAYASGLRDTLDAICFGSLALRSAMSRETILGYLDSLPENTLRVFDINLRLDYYTGTVIKEAMRRANIIKLNDDELAVLTKLWNLPQPEAAGLHHLVDNYHLSLAILTKGDKGSIVLSPGDFSSHPAIPRPVADTIGAGDAFTAMATLCFLQGLPPKEINERSSRLAAHVCSYQGAMVPPPADLKL